MADTWRRVWGDGKNFRQPRRLFLKKLPFSGKNFWLPFFSHRPGFSNFPSLLHDFPDLYFVRYVRYHTLHNPFLTRKTPFFHFGGKNFWWPSFLVIDQVFQIFTDFPDLYFVRYRTQPFPHKKNTFFTFFILWRTSDNTTFQNIGGTYAWAVPHLKLWGDRPPSPPRFPPLISISWSW